MLPQDPPNGAGKEGDGPATLLRALPGATVRAELRTLPGWQVSGSGRLIRTNRTFGDPSTAASFALTALLLGFFHDSLPEIHLQGRHVLVLLTNAAVNGVSPRELRLARCIQDVFAPPSAVQQGAGPAPGKEG